MGEVSEEAASPAERRRLKVRGAILSAAERVFADEGESGLSIRRIAEEIDYSPAAIYKYFVSKDELVDELKEAFFERILDQVHLISNLNETPLVRARKCVTSYINTALEKPHHYAAAFVGTASFDQVPKSEEDFLSTNKGQAFNALVNLLAKGVESGELIDTIDLTIMAKSAWASMHGLAMMIAHFPNFPAFVPGAAEMARADFIELHAETVIRAFERRPQDNGEGGA